MKKRLTRDVKHQKIAGVCAGIANYFDLDPTLVRVIWIVLACMAGGGILAYLIAWLVMPEDSGQNDEPTIIN
ncbi:PspC domain-containing protein [Streptococcus panodentis]|uniref:PspC family transcriptional regulator n=1 Tax=Streptococcus panodentis TaxID=1581472 RepID=A0ABS5AYL4_9STRE|nr:MULTISPECIES: PspC domain-containing protein [Streptococcus]KXT82420.1 PspC domain protein [Streptococcus sp. DD11]MBP2621668.1 PspC family transcriptional regulator [Streptococcus panodentis]